MEHDEQQNDIEALVQDWWTLPDIVERTGLSLREVRRQIEDRLVLSHRIGPRAVVAVPARFYGPQGPLPELRGTFTVLSDGGLSDASAIEWLFTPDDTLPVPGAPIDSILAGHKTEVRRRAMLLAL